MNWKKIIVFAVVLFVSGSLLGFVLGFTEDPNMDLNDAMKQFTISTLLTFIFTTVIFFIMAVRQNYRPYLHAWLAFFLVTAFSLVLMMALSVLYPEIFGGAPKVLVAIDVLAEIAGLIVGTSLGRYASRTFLRIKADV